MDLFRVLAKNRVGFSFGVGMEYGSRNWFLYYVRPV
jgi:hypothetical protein